MRRSYVSWMSPVMMAIVWGSSAPGADTPYRWKHIPKESFALVKGDDPVWQLRFDRKPPYLHPVRATNGALMSVLSPADHPWHFALWHSWKFLNGINFWDWAGQKDAVSPGQTAVSGREKVALESHRAVIEMDLDYIPGIGTSAGKAILREHRTIQAYFPRPDGTYTLDWTLSFTAPGQDVTASAYGYGGLGLRAPTNVKNIRVLDSEGRRGSESHTQRSRWVAFRATYEPGDKPAGVAMFDHPSNLRHPNCWWVGPDPVCAYLGTAFVCKEPYTIKKGETLRLRYRFWINAGSEDAQSLEKEWGSFRAGN